MNTRFAPSPTGHLHIGGVRTAIFNWVLARQSGGRFILRIDDTDVERNVPDAVDRITHGLKWLGLDWDDYFHQSDRVARYEQLCERLLQAGLAYRCYCSKEELEREREHQVAQGRAYRYTGRCRYVPFVLHQPCAIRVDVQRVAGNLDLVSFFDAVLGNVTVSYKDVSDFVIRRADGSFLYNFATAVDDCDFDITHVVRGQEHLSNTIPQLVLMRAFGFLHNTEFEPTTYAHVPFICAPGSHKKLSKREAETLGIPVTLDQYRELGYLPETMINYLSHLGWSLDDKTEKWQIDDLLESFKLSDVCKNPAAFDPDKLFWLQGEWMRTMDRAVLVEKVFRQYGQRHIIDRSFVERILNLAGTRFKLMNDFQQYLHFTDEKHFVVKSDALKKVLADGMPELLNKVKLRLEEQDDWSAQAIGDLVRGLVPSGQSAAPLIHALRAATTGQTKGIGVFEGIELLGKKRTCKRIDSVLSTHVQASSLLN